MTPNIFFGQDIPYTHAVTDDKELVMLLNIANSLENFSENYDGAIAIYEKVLKKIKDKKGSDNPEYAKTLVLYSKCFAEKSDYEAALEHATASYNYFKNDLNKDDQFHLLLLSNLSIIHHLRGDYDKALTFYLKTIDLFENAKDVDNTEYAILVNNVANLYDDIGQTKKSVEYLEKALEISNSTSNESTSTGMILNNLAFMYNKIENYDKSFELSRKSILHSKKHFGFNSSVYARSLNILALNFQDTKQYNKALENFEKSLEIQAEILGENHIDYARALVNIARLKIESDELKSAVTYLKQALSIIESNIGKQNLLYRSTQLELALVYQSEGKFKDAFPLLKESNNTTINQIEENFAYQTAIEKQGFITEIIGNQGLNYFANFNYVTDNSYPEALSFALNNVLTSKGLVLSATKDLLSDLKSLNDKSLNDSINKFIENRKYITTQLQLPLKERDATLKEAVEANSSLERILVNTNKKHFKSQNDYIKDFKETKLNKKDLAIEFTHFILHDKTWTDNVMYVAYLYKKGWDTPKVINLFEERELKEYFEKYSSRGAIASSNKKNEKIAISELLYEMIWQPLEPHLEDVETIYYSPDGLLHKVPLNALPTSQGRFLGEIYNMNRVSNTASVNLENEFPDLDDVLLIGDITYDYDQVDKTVKNEGAENSVLKSKELLGNEKNKKRNASRGSWAYLPGTKAEIEFIQDQLPKSKTLQKTDASESSLKELSGDSPSVLHISTHGFFFPDIDEDELKEEQTYKLVKDPLLRSGLILANANYAWQNGSNPYEEEDGILTALEISNLDLRNTSIVILSACDTGLGDIPSSEGVYGLQRAFKMAGVNTIIMTLWEVPDKETAEFMGKFYTKWKTNNDAKEAFKYAQSFMMKKYRYQPDKWAAFVYFE
ncbi:MAG: CHAT domain-containing protein [Nonlabens sp.]|uniref:CHAT domain-containing protein n=1 Tax=Nonlabens sp. TaxID=1888209 RepID=UPI003EF1D05F